MMLYEEWLEQLRIAVYPRTFFEFGKVIERGKTYSLISLDLGKHPDLIVSAGFHGNEPGNSMALLQLAPEMLGRAEKAGIGLRIYPCINPSGFETGHRYNLSGEEPNNTFLLYEVGGQWIEEVPPGTKYRQAKVRDTDTMPKETRALYVDVAVTRAVEPFATAWLDLHQDDQDVALGGITYAYVPKERQFYRKLIRSTFKHARPLTGMRVDEDQPVITDEDGLCTFDDGTATAYALFRGARYAAAVETSYDLPLPQVVEVDRIWIDGFIDAVAAAKKQLHDACAATRIVLGLP